MKYSKLVEDLQRGMNAQGEKLKIDGDPGAKTRGALLNFDVALTLKRVKTEVIPPPVTPIYSGSDAEVVIQLQECASWVFDCMTMLGWSEQTHDKQLTKLCWPQTDDCRGLPSVQGRSNAWCSGLWCGINHRNGVPSTRSGSAASWRTFGVSCGYIFGAFIPIRHPSMSNHIAVFLWWIDEKKKIAACIGGNQGDKVSIAAYNLSGNANGHEEVMGGPRWPKGFKQTSGPYQPVGWKVGTKLGASTR